MDDVKELGAYPVEEIERRRRSPGDDHVHRGGERRAFRLSRASWTSGPRRSPPPVQLAPVQLAPSTGPTVICDRLRR